MNLKNLQVRIQINQNNPNLPILFLPNTILMANPKLNQALKSAPKVPKNLSKKFFK